MAITYIMCVAGEGTRFQPIFGSLPKPLIRLKGRTMLEWSLQSLPLLADDRIVFVSQARHRLREKMHAVVENVYPFCSIAWHEIACVTSGQLETALLAENYALPECPIVIYNCDTYFQSKHLLTLFERKDIDGIVPCAKAVGDSWSFCKVNNKNIVVDIREKKRISDWASVGLYYFRESHLFFKNARKHIENNKAQECYVAPLYADYIECGKKILLDPVHIFKPMGTPEQLSEYWDVDAQCLKVENDAPVMVMDLDGTITIDDPAVSYAEKVPNVPVIDKMRILHAKGWKIIIHTSRRMQTCSNDESRVIANVGETTLEWLKRHGVPYDGLKFGKPYAHNGYYVDDRAMNPEEFIKIFG